MTNERAAQVLIAAYSIISKSCGEYNKSTLTSYEIACSKAVGLLMNTPDIIEETEG